MQRGITQIGDKSFCQNCKHDVTKRPYNFCPVCGAPLTQKAIDYDTKYEYKKKREMLREMNELAKSSDIKSVTDLLGEFLIKLDNE